MILTPTSNFPRWDRRTKEEIDSDVDTVLADIAKWSDPLRPI